MRIVSFHLRLGVVALAVALTVTGAVRTAAAASPACEGAVVHSVDATQPVSPLCIAVGGVVRVTNIGPGTLVAQPSTMVDCFYAAGTYQCRLIRTGTVRLTLGSASRELTVRVPATVPGQPTTACAQPGSTVNLDTTDELRWWSPCLRIGAALRFVNLGPGLLTAAPANAVTCHYAAGIHACQFRRPATVAFTAETRTVTAVAIR